MVATEEWEAVAHTRRLQSCKVGTESAAEKGWFVEAEREAWPERGVDFRVKRLRRVRKHQTKPDGKRGIGTHHATGILIQLSVPQRRRTTRSTEATDEAEA